MGPAAHRREYTGGSPQAPPGDRAPRGRMAAAPQSESCPVTLSLRDTLSRSVRPVEPIEPGVVRMYTCGPTVYRYAHVGNLRSYLLADLIRRTLLYHGLEVFHVKNITDVGPPARRAVRPRRGPDAGPGRARAQDAGRDRRRVRGRLPRRRGARQHPAGERLPAGDGARRRDGRRSPNGSRTPAMPTPRPRATSTTPSRRSRTTAACRATRSTSCAPGIAARSSRTSATRPTSRCGRPPARAASSSGRRRAGARASRAGTSNARRWRCATSGDRFDIHTGGIDNVFPHHEDEIAQSAPFVGGVPANHWVHGEFLLMSRQEDGEVGRATSSASPSWSIAGIDPLAFRYLVLTSRYAHKLDYSDESIDGRRGGPDLAAGAAARARAAARRRAVAAPPVPLRAGGRRRPAERASPRARSATAAVRRGSCRSDRGPAADVPLSAAGRALHERFVAAIDDDLDMPAALVVVREVLRADLPADERRWLVLDADQVLGLDLDRVWDELAAGGRGARRRAGAGRRARRGPGCPRLRACRRAPRRDRGRRVGGRGLAGRVDHPSPGLVAAAYVELTSRSRRQPNRSMIR